MQVRYQLRHSPNFRRFGAFGFRLLARPTVRTAPKQLKYLRTAFPKIPNRAYSALSGTCYSESEPAAALAEVSSPSCKSTTGQSFQSRSRA